MNALLPLRRHLLVWLDPRGWAALQTAEGARRDPVASDCLAHWAVRDLPLVVTRQSPGDDGSIALGLPAPTRWQRRRLALRVKPDSICRVGEFPLAQAIAGLLVPARRSAWQALIERIDSVAAAPTRVYGSYGWEAVSGESCVRAGSDLDLLLAADDAAGADAICEALEGEAAFQPRLDGELQLGGAGIAWREWRQSRLSRPSRPGPCGAADRVLAKSLDGVWLVDAATLTIAR